MSTPTAGWLRGLAGDGDRCGDPAGRLPLTRRGAAAAAGAEAVAAAFLAADGATLAAAPAAADALPLLAAGAEGSDVSAAALSGDLGRPAGMLEPLTDGSLAAERPVAVGFLAGGAL